MSECLLSFLACNIDYAVYTVVIVIVRLQLAGNHVTMLRSTLTEFYEELERKLLTAGRQTSARRPGSSREQGLVHSSQLLLCLLVPPPQTLLGELTTLPGPTAGGKMLVTPVETSSLGPMGLGISTVWASN